MPDEGTIRARAASGRADPPGGARSRSPRSSRLALYGDGGFFTRARGAGRAGADFVTSPEVGPLFGALRRPRPRRLVARPRATRSVRRGRGRRGTGRLAADVLRGRARVRAALRYVLVERSPGAAGRAARAARPSSRSTRRSARRIRDSDDDAAGLAGHRDRARSSPRSTSSPRCTSTAWCSPTSCSTTCRSASSSAPPTGGSRSGSAADGDGFVEALVPAAEELAAEADLVVAARSRCPPARACPVPHHRVVDVARRRARRCCAAACSPRRLRRDRGRARSRGRAPAGCAPTAATSAGRPARRPRASRTSPPTCPSSTSCTRPPAPGSRLRVDVTQAEWLRAARHRRARRRRARRVGAPARTSATSRPCGPQPRHRGRRAHRSRRARRPPRARLRRRSPRPAGRRRDAVGGSARTLGPVRVA